MIVVKETEEETNTSLQEPIINDVPLKWRTESNDETTEEEEDYNERLVD